MFCVIICEEIFCLVGLCFCIMNGLLIDDSYILWEMQLKNFILNFKLLVQIVKIIFVEIVSFGLEILLDIVKFGLDNFLDILDINF